MGIHGIARGKPVSVKTNILKFCFDSSIYFIIQLNKMNGNKTEVCNKYVNKNKN